MQVHKTAKDYVNIIAEAIRAEVEYDNRKISLRILKADKIFEFHLQEVETALEKLLEMEETEEIALHNARYYEILVKEESAFHMPRIRLYEKSLIKEDKDNNITYTLSMPSEPYLLFLINKLSQIAPINYTLGMFPYNILTRRTSERDTIKTIFDLIRTLFPQFLTLRIESGKNTTTSDFFKYANALFFQLSYNLDIAYVPQRYLDDFVRTSRITRIRRTNIEDQDVPKRTYLPDLVYQYQMAISTDSSPLQYLSYYHIAEYFFESVFQDTLIEKIRTKITQPDFSYKRKNDIKGIIDEVSKSIKFRSEKVTFSEQDALKLTIKRFVNLLTLLQRLKEYDSSLLDYYKTHKVSFSDGVEIDLTQNDERKVITAISNRIYKTRNAVVHSKQNDKSRYIPFKHDKELVKEIPLLRFIAEEIILQSSSLMQ